MDKEQVINRIKETAASVLPKDLQIYSQERRHDILRITKQYGASIRQLERLTGISFAIVRMA